MRSRGAAAGLAAFLLSTTITLAAEKADDPGRAPAAHEPTLLRLALAPVEEALARLTASLTPPLPGARPPEFAIAPGRLVVTVSLDAQTMNVSLDGLTLHDWPVSTGRRGYDTPQGTWNPYRLAPMWRSRQYDDAEMPFSIFFHEGYAIHGTRSVRALGSVASHGCVRLATENAETLFNLTRTVGSGEVDIVIVN